MSKIFGLEEWKLHETKPGADRLAEVRIIIEYPDPTQFIELEPKERINQIDTFYHDKIEKLVALNLFIEYNLVSNNRRDIGVTAKVRYEDLDKFDAIGWLPAIEVLGIGFATKRKRKQVERDVYFCVAMTVVVEVEGLAPKRETTEKRFVLVKAKSHEDAYDKVELQREAYAEPYLNGDGRFVRWRIDSLDDSFETDIRTAADLDAPEGVEIYSKLGERKSKPRPVWDGKQNSG